MGPRGLRAYDLSFSVEVCRQCVWLRYAHLEGLARCGLAVEEVAFESPNVSGAGFSTDDPDSPQ